MHGMHKSVNNKPTPMNFALIFFLVNLYLFWNTIFSATCSPEMECFTQSSTMQAEYLTSGILGVEEGCIILFIPHFSEFLALYLLFYKLQQSATSASSYRAIALSALIRKTWHSDEKLTNQQWKRTVTCWQIPHQKSCLQWPCQNHSAAYNCQRLSSK